MDFESLILTGFRLLKFESIFAVDFKTDYNVEIEKLMELMLRENC